MANAATEYEYDRIPYLIRFEEKSAFKDTYAGEIDRVVLEAHHLKPRGVDSKTVVIFMHPIGGGQYLPMSIALAKQGVHVIYCNSRYRGVDYALIMEKVAIDLGACVRDAKTRLGYDKVLLGGWSGGGSLSLFYQAEAADPRVRCTPAGESPDLSAQGLIPVDGLMLLAAHMSRNRTLTDWLDASILDENDLSKRDTSLDLYAPDGPKPPYSAEFVARYRAAQIARNRRITAWVKQKLAELKAAGRTNEEFCFLVQGTMADPRWLDPALDANDRKPQWCFLGEPRVVNMSPIGLARFCSLRSWLSQWSYDDSNADGPRCATRIQVPVLIIGNSADDGCPPSHNLAIHDAIPHSRKELVTIKGANHYYFGQPDKAREAAQVCIDWMKRQNFLN